MHVELKTAPQKGRGVYATRAFRVGELVMEGRIARYVTSNNSHASQIGKTTYVEFEGLRVMVNHSCSPSCGIQLNEMGGHDLIAMKAIATGDEITYDYAMENYNIDYFPAQCQCQAPNCRGQVTGWKDLSQKVRERYRGFVAPYLLEL